MISKNEIKYIQSLFHKKTRDEEGLFICEGVKFIRELTGSNFTIRKLYATSLWVDENNYRGDVATITEAELARISHLSTPNQVLAIVEKSHLPAAFSLKDRFTLVLDGIQDPGNFGTIIRTADWFGIEQVIASMDCADMYNPKTVQSTMGSIFRVNILYKDIAAILAECPVPVYGALLNGKSVYNTSPVHEAVLIIGNESKGIRSTVMPLVQHPVTIPPKGKAESLNAAVATGILLACLLQ